MDEKRTTKGRKLRAIDGGGSGKQSVNGVSGRKRRNVDVLADITRDAGAGATVIEEVTSDSAISAFAQGFIFGALAAAATFGAIYVLW